MHFTVHIVHRELSFKKGDIIKLTRTVDNNWLEGEVDGAKGIFPTSYIEVYASQVTHFMHIFHFV